MHAPLIDALNETIHRFSGKPGGIDHLKQIGGGSISRALVAGTPHGNWFIKINNIELLEMFNSEADGLRALGDCPTLRVPDVAGTGSCGQQAFLILEHLDMQPLQDTRASIAAGRTLASLHRITGHNFGWNRDNFIGSTPQSNRPKQNWPDFFTQERLLPQLNLARRNGHTGALLAAGALLAEKLHAFFAGYQPEPSLLHGDLWHGNAAADAGGNFILFDPAVYFGDREADLAMTELFGGFPAGFHAAYREAWPLAEGYPQRRTLYNLYHVLNHLNLFGGSYRRQAEHMIGQLLAELG